VAKIYEINQAVWYLTVNQNGYRQDFAATYYTSKFQLEIEKQIPELVAYVKAKDLLYIDPSKPLVVRKEPAYMAELQEHQFRHQVLTIKC
jgi:hypothetical protein